MDQYLDEKEKRYFTYFGEPAQVAHDVFSNPHVDVYVFYNQTNDEYIYLTKGLEEAGFRELMMIITKKEQWEKWPVYFLQALCNYLILEGAQVNEMETYDNAEDILDANGFNQALFLSVAALNFDPEEIKTKLGLNNSPLYVFPITTKELGFALNNDATSLVEKMIGKIAPFGSVTRESVI